ncbi:MAG TPA: very short patch repair endonuclease [Ramlibacter sp.]|nr:very short patch repair endonuclease [Ramlibacter sp.]
MKETAAELRSRTMRAIRSQGNRSTEVRLAAILRRAGLRGWRRHLPLAGTPDFAWPARKVALFVDGCFWHGCPVCQRSSPATNAAYWQAKIARNMRRDRRVARALRAQGWAVIRVWEHALGGEARLLARVRRALSRNA